jgi:SAM-dependent methyltransferase
MMAARDPHRFVNEFDGAMVARMIERLEGRGKDAVFTRLFDRYANELTLAEGDEALEIGSGTGVVSRSLARRAAIAGQIIGVDHGEIFVKAARGFATEEGLGDKVDFRIGDAHDLPFDDGRFALVVAHTVLSHVTNPGSVLDQARRVLRPGGRLVIFDGDYVSLTYRHADAEAGRHMDWALTRSTFNNPTLIRDLPGLLGERGIAIEDTLADIVTEIGASSYFRSMAETYAPLIPDSGLASREEVDSWLTTQRQAMDDGTFFASCNYYSYIARRPAEG